MCKIDANPINADTVKFTREGFDFESRTKVTTISGRNFYLTVYNVTEADAGKFTCEVNNGVGETVSNSSFLLVRRKYISVFPTTAFFWSNEKRSTKYISGVMVEKGLSQ